MADKPKHYRIAYNEGQNKALAYPNWKGIPSGSIRIGEYTPTNPRANLEDYLVELKQEIVNRLWDLKGVRLEAIEIVISPLDGSKDVHIVPI